MTTTRESSSTATTPLGARRGAKSRKGRAASHMLGMIAFGLVVSTQPLSGEDRPRYRGFRLGADLASVSALTGVPVSEAKTVHARPGVMQELEWRPRYSFTGAVPTQPEPVQQMVFSFFNDQLFKVVVDYDRERTEGMTDADMIEGISTEYGAPLLKVTLKKPSAVESQRDETSGPPVARWGDADYSVVLFHSSYAPGFRLVVISTRLEGLARAAGAQALRLDEREAPQRELARQKKEAEATRVSQEKARLPNKAAFRP